MVPLSLRGARKGVKMIKYEPERKPQTTGASYLEYILYYISTEAIVQERHSTT